MIYNYLCLVKFKMHQIRMHYSKSSLKAHKIDKEQILIILFAKVFLCRLKETKNNEFENKYSSRAINVYRFDGKCYLALLINYINHGVPSIGNLIRNVC